MGYRNKQNIIQILIFAIMLSIALSACGGGGSGGGSNSGSSGGSGGSGANLSGCGSNYTFFDYLPVDMTAVTGIIPLGNLNPPAHTYPTDHIYMTLDTQQFPVDVFAPGDVTITRVGRQHYLSGFRENHTDYSLTMQPCSDIDFVYGHVTRLTQTITDAIGNFSDCYSYGTGTETVESCSKNVNISVTSGQKLGEIDTYPGGTHIALDLGLYDDRITIPFVNATRNEWHSSAVCPVDYFDSATRPTMEARFGSFDGSTLRTISPVCGEIDFDIAGTAQGIWVLNSGADEDFYEMYGLALVKDNIDPTEYAISAGDVGTSIDGSIVRFTPADAGTVDRDFADVTADGQIYCYNSGNAILIELLDTNTLKFEVQDGQTCGANAFTSNALTFVR